MLMENNFYALYLAKLKGDEMIKIAEISRINREAKLMRKSKKDNKIIARIVEGTGKILVFTGNKLQDIA